MIGQIVGKLHPRLLRLQVGGARDVQVRIGPYLGIRVKAWSSERVLKQTDTMCTILI